MKTILLIGASGNLGSRIARALLTRGATLRLLVRPGSRTKLAAEASQVRIFNLDRLEEPTSRIIGLIQAELN